MDNTRIDDPWNDYDFRADNCKFCGAEIEPLMFTVRESGAGPVAFMECASCHARGPWVDQHDFRGAVEAMNAKGDFES